MISRQIRDTMAKAMMDELARRGLRTKGWATTSESHREAYRRAMHKALGEVGVKVEGEEPDAQDVEEEVVF